MEEDGNLYASGGHDSYYAKFSGMGKAYDMKNYYCTAGPFSNFTAAVSGSTISFTETSYAALQYNQELYYEWYFEDGQESNLTTPSIIFDNAKYPTGFWAALVVTNGVLCKDTITKNVYTNEILENPKVLGIRETDSYFRANDGVKGEMLVYPNPATSVINVVIPANAGISGLYGKIFIYNAQGQEIDCFVPRNDGKIEVDVSNYPKGVYIVVLQGDAIYLKSEHLLVY